MCKTTFINTSGEFTKDVLKKTGLKSLKSRRDDFNFFLNVSDESEELGNFNEYGLCFDYVEANTFEDQQKGYYRYQLSYGGPSEEIRFYSDGTIIFVYLNWYCGIGFNVTNDSIFQTLKNWFIDFMTEFYH